MLRLDQVSLEFGHGVPILNGVNLDLAQGDFRFLTGPSGAGKTSLLRIISMSLAPTGGCAWLFGERLEELSRKDRAMLRRRIGFIYQDFKLLDHLNVFDNVALPLRIAGSMSSGHEQDVLDLLDWVGLRGRTDDFPPALSGGEKQRVAIARAVVGKPDLILADEPTGSVDPAHARRLLRLFVELNKQGTTVLLATHDESLLKQPGAAVLHLANGELQRR